MTRRNHIVLPTLAFLVLAVLFTTTTLDVIIARSLFFDSLQGQWVGKNNWWLNEVLHTGGRWAIRIIVLVAVVLWILANERRPRLRELRRPLAYFIVSMVLSVGVVGLLKVLTNVDCPWDLTDFGGRFPFVHLFADRPDALRRAQCFPAAHSSSGYALLALYFMFRERSVTLARWGMAFGIGVGLLFGFAQQARGAHFMSHDLWSAFIVWMISLGTYAGMFRMRLWSEVARPSQQHRSGVPCDQAGSKAPPLITDGYAGGRCAQPVSRSGLTGR